MRRLLGAAVAVVAVLAVAVIAVLTAGAKPNGIDLSHTPGPGPAKIDVDTPELRTLKAQAGMEDCVAGPGGGALPDLTLDCLGGGTPVDLDSLHGPMVLSLWQAACGPCRKEMPALQAFHEQYAAQVPVLGVDFIDPFPAEALQKAEERGVTYPSVADPGGDLQQFEEFAKIPGLPVMYFLDDTGAIAYAKIGGVDSEAEIVDLVREHLGITL